MKRFRLFAIATIFVAVNLVKVMLALNLKFSKLECDEFDKPFASFKQCRLKALARHKVALSVHVQLHQIPVNNITVNAQLLRRGNGYRPFMYNNTADFCEFLRKPYRFMFWKILFDYIKKDSNINHTCPYDHDIIVNRLILDPSVLKLIPTSANDYMVRIRVGAYNHYKAEVRAYISIYD